MKKNSTPERNFYKLLLNYLNEDLRTTAYSKERDNVVYWKTKRKINDDLVFKMCGLKSITHPDSHSLSSRISTFKHNTAKLFEKL